MVPTKGKWRARSHVNTRLYVMIIKYTCSRWTITIALACVAVLRRCVAGNWRIMALLSSSVMGACGGVGHNESQDIGNTDGIAIVDTVTDTGEHGYSRVLLDSSLTSESTGSVEGLVQDGDGNPISMASVQVKRSLLGAATGRDGYYILRRVPIGPQWLVVTASGLKAEVIVKIMPDSVVWNNVLLEEQ